MASNPEDTGLEKDEFKQALANLQLLQSKFSLRINKLKALRHSVKHALASSKVSKEDLDMLETELDILDNLQQELETSSESFTFKFAVKHFEETVEARKSAEKSLNAFFELQVNLAMLMREVRHRLDGDASSEEYNESDEVQGAVEVGQSNDKAVDGSNSEQHQENEEQEKKTLSLKLKIAIGVFIVIAFYSFLGLIIQLVQDSEKSGKVATTRREVEQDNTTCGSDSFMLRDGVCDEVANIAKCLFDGGDCCKEYKDKGLCKDCKCILDVDQEQMRSRFKALEVRPFVNPASLETVIRGDSVIEVQNVVSLEVCSVLCLDHKRSDELNAWHYLVNEKICRCGWVDSKSCPEKMVNHDWTIDKADAMEDHRAFVQINKTVSCECLTVGLLLDGERSELAKVSHGDTSPAVHSLWHCQQLCHLYKDCVWVSWKDINSKESAGECRMMKEIPTEVAMSTYSLVDSEWVSSSINCSKVVGNFERHLLGNHYELICPRSNVSSMDPDRVKSLEDFILYVDGWTQSAIVVLKVVDGDAAIVECAHSIIPPEKKLTHASGGFLIQDPDPDNAVAVLCGGDVDETFDKSTLGECQILMSGESHPQDIKISAKGLLNHIRAGAKSLVVDDGRTLWLTGGSHEEIYSASEYVSVLPRNSTNVFPTNGAGPALPLNLVHHCVVRITSEVAMLMGGASYANNLVYWKITPQKIVQTYDDSWSINVKKMTWTNQPDLSIPRSRHACGFLRTGENKSVGLLVAAGGLDEHKVIFGHVETIMLTTTEEEAGTVTLAKYWETGPSLPIPLADAATAMTCDQMAMYIIGGSMFDDISSSVFQLVCSDIDQCTWTKMDYELKAPTKMGLALTMPQISMALRGFPNARDCLNGLGEDEGIFVLTTGEARYETDLGDTDTFVIPPWTSNQGTKLDRCIPPPYQTQSMFAMSHATGGVVTVQDLDGGQQQSTVVPMVCGGRNSDLTGNHNCYQLNILDGWAMPKVVGKLQESRVNAASVTVFNGTTLWVTGGKASTTNKIYDTTELICPGKNATSSSEEGIQLPTEMYGHCLEVINSHIAIVYGGSEDSSRAWTIDEFINLDNYSPSNNRSWWVEVAPMAIPRYFHVCGVIQEDILNKTNNNKYVVAAGGVGTGDTVELLRVDEDGGVAESWDSGPKMPQGTEKSASAVSKDQSVMFVAGGWLNWHHEVLQQFLESIYSLRCANGGVCWWTVEGTKLLVERHSAVALFIPPTMNGDDIFRDDVDLCQRNKIGDGMCQAVNNNAKCEFDGGDCCTGEDPSCIFCYGQFCLCHETGEYHCTDRCNDDFVENGQCDGTNNVIECNYDDGDCCLPNATDNSTNSGVVYCNVCDKNKCHCHETNDRHCIMSRALDVGNCLQCAFPFTYFGVVYNDCTMVYADEPWCATTTDENYDYIEGWWEWCQVDSCFN